MSFKNELVRVRVGGTAVTTKEYRVIVVSGNGASIGNNLEGIRYVQNITTPATTLDPNNESTAYPDGLGRGILIIDGVKQSGFVLVRHNLWSYAIPALAGSQFSCPSTVSITASDSTVMTAYLLDWVK